MKGSVWTRERPAPAARETLSREQIVKAAVEMLDADGLAGLSMRKLGAKLNAGATSLYWHVQTKDDLLELVADEVYGEIDVPEADAAGWRSVTTQFAHGFRAAILRHPWFPEVATTRPSIGPNAVAIAGRLLAVLRAGGFTGLDVDMAMGAVITYVLGVTSAETSWRAAIARAGQTMREWIDDVTVVTAEASRDNADVQESMRARRGADPEELQERTFSFGLESMLDGLALRAGS